MDMIPDTSNPITQDFQRDVWCLFGLPIDNLTLQESKVLLKKRVCGTDKSVLSTINVNWVVESLKNNDFRAAILNSEIVTLDGKPLLWLSKLLGCPMTEVVAGSTLIQELQQNNNAEEPLSLFLFGGEKDVACQALKKVNYRKGGLYAVDALNPGFRSVEEMSSEQIIVQINQSKPDILLVALGAKKGTQWIERNRKRINAKVISHLGATINFLAGTVQRAPGLMRKLGMEWAWRIIQEPKLFSRYLKDGLEIAAWLLQRLYLYGKYLLQRAQFDDNAVCESVERQDHEKEIILKFGRSLQVTKYSLLRDLFAQCIKTRKNIKLDFRQTLYANSAFLGLLLILMKHQRKQGLDLAIVGSTPQLSRILSLFCIPESMQALGFNLSPECLIESSTICNSSQPA